MSPTITFALMIGSLFLAILSLAFRMIEQRRSSSSPYTSGTSCLLEFEAPTTGRQ